MVEPPTLAVGATKLVETCANVQPGESVLVVTDPEKLSLARAVATAATRIASDVTICEINGVGQDGAEPSRTVRAAMKAADVIFTPITVSITHTEAMRDACARGARAVVMTGFTTRMMQGGGLEADFWSLKPLCEQIAEYFDRGTNVRVTTPAGTDVQLSIAGRPGIAKTCIVGPGEFSPVPDVEATVSPVEGSAEGLIVADASIPYLGIGVLSAPIRFQVQAGRIVSLEGDQMADRLRDAWAAMNDVNVYNVAELGIGLNPACQLTGEMLEDEGCWGVLHFGTGTNITLGGTIKAACHYDLLMHRASVQVDEHWVLIDGEPQFGDGDRG
jgi:2,5-dihydroxypyridine 5,6-dioxygenase